VSQPRKKWEPCYRFGGNKASWFMPKPLGENQNTYRAIIKKPKKKKK